MGQVVKDGLYHKHLSKQEIINICKHLVEKNGIRLIERITGHHRDTISRIIEDLALHAEMVNSVLFHEVKLGQFEVVNGGQKFPIFGGLKFPTPNLGENIKGCGICYKWRNG